MTFGRISLDSLIVRVQDEQQEIQSVSQFLEEVFRVASVEQAKLDSFMHELEQTIFKDTIAQYERNNKKEYNQKSYDEFESHLIDAIHITLVIKLVLDFSIVTIFNMDMNLCSQ